MAGLRIDDAAWTSAWRDHGLGGKTFLSGGLLLAALVLPVWPASVLVVLTSTVLALVPARTAPGTLLRALAAPVTFIALSSVAVAVTVEVDPSWSIGISDASVLHAAEVVGRAVACTLAVLLLSLTTPMTDVMSGLRRVGVPAACVEVAGLMYGMTFMLLDTSRTIRRSQVARLGNRSLAQTVRSCGDLMAMVLVRSWDQARRLERGLAGRGYTGQLVTVDDAPRTRPVFVVATAAGLAATVALSVLLGASR